MHQGNNAQDPDATVDNLMFKSVYKPFINGDLNILCKKYINGCHLSGYTKKKGLSDNSNPTIAETSDHCRKQHLPKRYRNVVTSKINSRNFFCVVRTIN